MKFTKKQIDSILDILRKNQAIFIYKNVGEKYLSQSDRLILKKFGINLAKIDKINRIEKAFYFGIIAKTLGDPKMKKISFEDLNEIFERNSHLKLSPSEQSALDYLKQRAYTDISGLGNRIINSTNQLILKANLREQRRLQKIIGEKSQEAIKTGKSSSWLASELRNETKDWSRDFDRISDFIMHEAYDTGRAIAISQEFGNEATVYKDVYERACKDCIRLYLTGGIGSEPKTFKVGDLIANGNNIGVNKSEWKPVVGATHPYCRCTLNYKMENTVWDDEQKRFVVKRNTQNIKRTSKISIKVDGKEI